MTLVLAVHTLLVDIDQLARLYQQLNDVPHEVQHLFGLIADVRARLASLEQTLPRGDPGVEDSQQPFKDFRKRLLDLELFIDPEQVLPRSGPGSTFQRAVPWRLLDEAHLRTFCEKFRTYVFELDGHCNRLATGLRSAAVAQIAFEEKYNPPAQDPNPPPIPEKQEFPFGFRMPSPLMLPPSLAPNSQPASPHALSPQLPPFAKSQGSTPLLPPFSQTTPFTYSRPPVLLPCPPILSPRRRPKTPIPRTRASIRIQELVEQHTIPVVGIKRKYDEGDTLPPIRIPHDIIPNNLPSTLPPAPSIPPKIKTPPKPPSPLLSPRNLAEDDPSWSLDELTEALPPSFHQWGPAPPIPPRNRAPEPTRVTLPDIPPLDTASIFDSSSSSNYTSSSNSIYSHQLSPSTVSLAPTTSSRDRAFDLGAFKIWYRATAAATLTPLIITHIEVQHLPPPPPTNGNVPHPNFPVYLHAKSAIRLMLRTPSQARPIPDDLWISSFRCNAAPFLEHSDIVNAFRSRDPSVNYVIRFAPHAAFHPQYTFTTRDDAFSFASTVVGKTLVCSVDVESIKSALTHGNAFELGCGTLQVWETQSYSPGGRQNRTVRFARNKNPTAVVHVVEFDAKCLRPPEKERKTGKLVFGLREGNGPESAVVREMRYLKVAFGQGTTAREEFLKAVGLRF